MYRKCIHGHLSYLVDICNICKCVNTECDAPERDPFLAKFTNEAFMSCSSGHVINAEMVGDSYRYMYQDGTYRHSDFPVKICHLCHNDLFLISGELKPAKAEYNIKTKTRIGDIWSRRGI